jgi:Ni,Fe-hydrogenase maturation factor
VVYAISQTTCYCMCSAGPIQSKESGSNLHDLSTQEILVWVFKNYLVWSMLYVICGVVQTRHNLVIVHISTFIEEDTPRLYQSILQKPMPNI